MPTRNDEYLLYQILIGVWPLRADTASAELCERLKNYMLKAAREATQSTSWANKNLEYETALISFVDSVLDPAANQEFISDFLTFQRRIASIGMMNSLSQTLIKLMSPGVPDIYQGNELSEFSLVDPDNRRPSIMRCDKNSCANYCLSGFRAKCQKNGRPNCKRFRY